ncbi:MAG: HAMP domain-containing sensor histidine kinase [Ignavibacteriales bacterium]|nr:HAMP domain-containing sensor histidine kinase [Ignavibacteriales bacterium]
MLSIKAKIVIAYTFVFGALLTGFAMLTYAAAYDNEVAKLDARLESHADKIATELEEDSHEPGFPSRTALDSIQTGGLPAVKVRLLTLDRNVVFADPGFSLESDVKWKKGTVSNAQKSTAKIARKKIRIMQWPVEIDDKIQYLVQIAAPMHDVEDNLEPMRVLFLVLIPVGLMLSGGAAYLISVLAFRPMMRMVKTAETISATTLDARLDLPNVKDEVHLLGRALNEMIDRIDGAIKSQRQFVADASHELRTPLTIMKSELEFAHRTAKRSKLKETIGTSVAELDHLSSLVNDLLTLARLDGAQLKLEIAPIRLDEMLVECVQAVSGVAKRKGVALKLFIEEAVEIRGDQKKLMSVFLNLLDNAIKYSSKNKKVSATLTISRGEPRKALIVIKDNGPGIPQSEHARVFTRFYRGSQSRSQTEGSGLGLAIAQRFVELHGGQIVLQSAEGRGSTFTVELPVSDDSRPGVS